MFSFTRIESAHVEVSFKDHNSRLLTVFETWYNPLTQKSKYEGLLSQEFCHCVCCCSEVMGSNSGSPKSNDIPHLFHKPMACYC